MIPVIALLITIACVALNFALIHLTAPREGPKLVTRRQANQLRRHLELPTPSGPSIRHPPVR
jgi:hypothetical protein